VREPTHYLHLLPRWSICGAIPLLYSTPSAYSASLKRSTESRSLLFCDVMKDRLVVTDVSGQPVGTNIKGQTVFLDCLTIEDGADMLCRNVCSYQSVLRNVSEKRRSNLYRGGSLDSRKYSSPTSSLVALSTLVVICINLLKPSGDYMYHRF
jgi:hypothetical protein